MDFSELGMMRVPVEPGVSESLSMHRQLSLRLGGVLGRAKGRIEKIICRKTMNDVYD